MFYKFHVIPIKIPGDFFAEIDKLILKLRIARTQIAKTTLKMKNKVGGHTPQFEKLLLKRETILINPVPYWCKDRHIDQWSGNESRNKPRAYGQLVLGQAAKTV